MALQIRRIYWPTRQEVQERGAEYFQAIVANTFDRTQVTTLQTKCWLLRLEYGRGTTAYFLETAPSILREFIQIYAARGLEEFIKNIRTLASHNYIVFDSSEGLFDELVALRTDIQVMRNMKIALNLSHRIVTCRVSAIPRSQFRNFIEGRRDAVISQFTLFDHRPRPPSNEQTTTPARAMLVNDRPFLPRWGFGWPVAIYHGNDVFRIRNSIITYALQKAAEKNERRRRNIERIEQKIIELRNYYGRKMANFERALSIQNEKTDRTNRRAERLRLTLQNNLQNSNQ